MSEEIQESNYELDALKAKADLLGIKYHHKEGPDRLRIKIENHLAEKENPVASEGLSSQDISFLSEEEFKKQEKNHRKLKANSMVRIRLTCLNPDKKAWPGEVFSVGSAKLGTFKRYVPFSAEDGWHVPHILFEMIKERKYSHRYIIKDSQGRDITKSKLVNEFAVEVLPPLTKEELKELARKQSMNNTGE